MRNRGKDDKQIIKGQKQSRGRRREMRRWGGDESSPSYQPWWAGLLWGWQCDTYAETHTQRDAGHHAAYTVRLLLPLCRRVEDNTGMPLGHIVHTLAHMHSQTQTRNDDG